MKKRYIKPEIIIEDFSLNMSIAGDCERKTNLQSNNVCGMEFGTSTVFIQGVEGCQKKVKPTGQYDGICYHNPSDNNNLFNS